MASPSRVFVSYTHENISGQEKELVIQLLDDLKNVGVEIITDENGLSEAQFLALVQRELSSCQWFMLIQTAESLYSLRTQVAMNQAIQQTKQDQTKGILRIICPSSETEQIPPLWSETPAYTFSGDYPRLRDKVLLELNLLRIEDVANKHISQIATSTLPQSGAIAPNKAQLTPSSLLNQSSTTVNGDQSVPPTVLPTASVSQSDRPMSTPPAQIDRPISMPSSRQRKRRFLLVYVLPVTIVLLIVAASGSAFLIFRPPAPIPPQFPYAPYHGVLKLNDPLHDNSRGYNWDLVSTSSGNCSFDTTYNAVEIHQGQVYYCTEKSLLVRNFVFQVEMVLISGDFGGIVFRSQGPSHYFFRIGADGSYYLKVHVNDANGEGYAMAQGTSKAIKVGLNQKNVLAVVARGGNFDLYVNNTLVVTAQDNSYSQGVVGVFAEEGANPTEVAFSNAKVWAL